MRLPRLRRDATARIPRGRLADEAGSFLVEAMVSALVLLTAGAGVLKMMDRGSELNGQQKAIATAGNLAQSEQETLRGYPLSSLSNLRRTTTREVRGATYTITSRTDWINDDSGAPTCATVAASADYMKLTSTVTSPAIASRKPVTLESLITPPARTFGPTQGSLAVQVNDRNGAPVTGLTLDLSGPATLSDVTNVNGCVLWGYLAEGSGYAVGATSGGYVQPNGSPTIAEPASVIGDQTANVSLTYDRAGGINAAFTTQRPGAATPVTTAPLKAMVESSNAAYIPTAYSVAGDQLSTGVVLFPFTDPYSIYADSCSAAKPPAEHLGSALAPPGATSDTAIVRIPALNIVVQDDTTLVSNARVKVTSPCGNVYERRTLSTGTGLIGLIDDPGFPYGDLVVCVANSLNTRHYDVPGPVDNTNFAGTDVTYDIGTSNADALPGPCS